jgi:iron complex transport system substrate-binding protein
MSVTRIVSLLPAATDIVVALGAGDRLAAVTHECDMPPELGAVPVITRSTLSAAGLTSRAIDAHVNAAAHGGSSLYVLDQEALARLDPDVILTQELCEVCAISYTQVAGAVHRLRVAAQGVPKVVSLEPHTLGEVLDGIQVVGDVIGATDRAAAVVKDLRGRLDDVARRAAGAPRLRVFAMEWLDPPYTAGHWVPEMVATAGGRDDLATAGAYSHPIDWSAVTAYDPDVIVLMPCSFDLARTLAEFAALPRPDGWDRLRAVEAGRVYAADSGRYFSRSGPALVDGVEILGEIFHPERFPRRHSAAWQAVPR